MPRKQKLIPRIEETGNETVNKIREEVRGLSKDEQNKYKPQGVPLYALDARDFRTKNTMPFYRRVLKAGNSAKHRRNTKEIIEHQLKSKNKKVQKKEQMLEINYWKKYNRMVEQDRTRKRRHALKMVEARKELRKLDTKKLKMRTAKSELRNKADQTSILLLYYANIILRRLKKGSHLQETTPEEINGHGFNFVDSLDIDQLKSAFSKYHVEVPKMLNFSAVKSVNAETAIHQYSDVVDCRQGNDISGSQNKLPSAVGSVGTSLDASIPNERFSLSEQSLDLNIPELTTPSLSPGNNGILPGLSWTYEPEIMEDALSFVAQQQDMTLDFVDHEGVTTHIFEDQGLFPASLNEDSFNLLDE